MGIVPENPLAREFRDLAGFLNQRIAEVADDVYMVTAGIPVKIK
jgi:adenosylcobinamide kinase/adenosylcobinamide-phosphate guanylyltransferase